MFCCLLVILLPPSFIVLTNAFAFSRFRWVALRSSRFHGDILSSKQIRPKWSSSARSSKIFSKAVRVYNSIQMCNIWECTVMCTVCTWEEKLYGEHLCYCKAWSTVLLHFEKPFIQIFTTTRGNCHLNSIQLLNQSTKTSCLYCWSV